MYKGAGAGELALSALPWLPRHGWTASDVTRLVKAVSWTLSRCSLWRHRRASAALATLNAPASVARRPVTRWPAHRAWLSRTPTFLYFRRRRHLWSAFSAVPCDAHLLFADAVAVVCNHPVAISYHKNTYEHSAKFHFRHRISLIHRLPLVGI